MCDNREEVLKTVTQDERATQFGFGNFNSACPKKGSATSSAQKGFGDAQKLGRDAYERELEFPEVIESLSRETFSEKMMLKSLGMQSGN